MKVLISSVDFIITNNKKEVYFNILEKEMARGKILNNTEIEIIKRLKDENKSNREIAKILGRSPKAVNNFFKKQKENVKPIKLGHPTKVSPRKRRAILKAASNFMLTLNQILIFLRKIRRECSQVNNS